MTSELKSATARANGAKSRGPKTPETRQKSSCNSLGHGFTAKKTIVLECENEDDFHTMLGYYAETYQPGSAVEEDLVAEMVAARWRIQRLRTIETALLDGEMNCPVHDPETRASAPDDPGQQLAQAFRRLVDESRAISLASRYESRLHRIHERCHRTLRELQQTRSELNLVSPLPEAEPPAPAPPSGPAAKNCETNLRPHSEGVKKDPHGHPIVAHRRIRRIENVVPLIKRLRYLGQRKTAPRAGVGVRYN